MVKCTTDGYAHCFPLLEGVCMYMHTLASGYISILCTDACMNDHLLMLHSQASPAPRSSLCVKDSKWRGCLVKQLYKRQLFALGFAAHGFIEYYIYNYKLDLLLVLRFSKLTLSYFMWSGPGASFIVLDK